MLSRLVPPLSSAAQALKSGVYRHYKGGEYRVFWVARHSERVEEELVVYQALATGEYWVRPVVMFAETVTVDGRQFLRFEWVRD